jgi:predicted RNA-binding protein with PIN domain
LDLFVGTQYNQAGSRPDGRPALRLIIDGYNLLYASGILPRGRGPATLERARAALLNFLAESLEPGPLARTAVVFDAEQAPHGLPHHQTFRGLTVLFAAREESADELIEELIAECTAPRALTVVSSDHRIQRAARRRRASAIDSDRWISELARRRGERSQAPPPPLPVSDSPVTSTDVEYWVKEFSDEDSTSADSLKGDLRDSEFFEFPEFFDLSDLDGLDDD